MRLVKVMGVILGFVLIYWVYLEILSLLFFTLNSGAIWLRDHLGVGWLVFICCVVSGLILNTFIYLHRLLTSLQMYYIVQIVDITGKAYYFIIVVTGLITVNSIWTTWKVGGIFFTVPYLGIILLIINTVAVVKSYHTIFMMRHLLSK
jgi:hypothetical protein